MFFTLQTWFVPGFLSSELASVRFSLSPGSCPGGHDRRLARRFVVQQSLGGALAPQIPSKCTKCQSYENVMEPTTGIEPVTPSLPRKCSTTEPRGPDFLAPKSPRDSKPGHRWARPWFGSGKPRKRPRQSVSAASSNQKTPIAGSAGASHRTPGVSDNGAGDGARTRDPQLGRLMLYQLSYSRPMALSYRPLRELDNLGRLGIPHLGELLVERGGFEPPKA